MTVKELCYYGCGNIALYLFKNGKWCCSSSKNKCLKQRELNSKNCIGKTRPPRTKEYREQISIRRTGTKQTKETKEKLRKLNLGRIISEETKQKMRLAKIGKKQTDEHKRKNSQTNLGKIISDKTKLKMKTSWTTDRREEQKNKMLKGGAVIALRGIKKISKPEIKLREKVKAVYNNIEFQYPVFNYLIDIAIPEYKIAIEYDGYFHFDTEEHKQYHKQRQEKIEKEGWKFLRYNKLPSNNILEADIIKIIGEILNG